MKPTIKPQCYQVVIFLVIILAATALSGQNARLTGENSIVFKIDGKWGEDPKTETFTDYMTGKNDIELLPGKHRIEFKYPRKDPKGKAYAAEFTAKENDIYIITHEDGDKKKPVIVTESNGKINDLTIRQVSAPLPNSKKTPVIIGDVDESESALFVLDKGFFKLYKITPFIYKVDDTWGPYPMGWKMRYNNKVNGNITMRLPPGKHTFELSCIWEKVGHKKETGVFTVEGFFEAGKTYTFEAPKNKEVAEVIIVEKEDNK